MNRRPLELPDWTFQSVFVREGGAPPSAHAPMAGNLELACSFSACRLAVSFVGSRQVGM